jgi:hypothetical protein
MRFPDLFARPANPAELHSPPSSEADIVHLRAQMKRLLFITEALWQILRDPSIFLDHLLEGSSVGM